MSSRPRLVTIGSFAIIASSVYGIGLSVVAGVAYHSAPLLLIGIVVSVVQLLVGIGMLRGKRMARIVFLWITPVLFIAARVQGGAIGLSTLIGIASYIVFATYLSRPTAVAYFLIGQHGSKDDVEIEASRIRNEKLGRKRLSKASKAEARGRRDEALREYELIEHEFAGLECAVDASSSAAALRTELKQF